MEEDPFAVFDSSSDDGSEGNTTNDNNDDDENPHGHADKDAHKNSSAPENCGRDAAVGPMTFHAGTEQALLYYVLNHQQQEEATNCTAEDDDSRAATQILQSIDDFCYQRHWMMHIGVSVLLHTHNE